MINIINLRTSKFFPDAFAYIGYFTILVGLVLIFKLKLWGIPLIILGFFLGFSFVGILIDIDRRLYKNYSSFFGIKKGSWESYENFKDLSIFTVNQSQKSYSTTGLEFKSKFKVYRVFMLDKSHREKVLLQEFKEKDLAVRFANEMSERMNMAIKIYNPVISESSQLKRR